MYLLLPFVYYSGLTGWNGYLYFQKSSFSTYVNGNRSSFDMGFSYGDMDFTLVSSSYGRSMDIRFAYSRFYYLSDSSIYVFALGISRKNYSLFAGVSSMGRPAIFSRIRYPLKFHRLRLFTSLSFRTVGGFFTPYRREEAWGFDRYGLKGEYVLSGTFVLSIPLWSRVVYAGLFPAGEKGVDLLLGYQISKLHNAYGAGIRFRYPVIGSFTLFFTYNPARNTWDTFAGTGFPVF